MNTTAEESTSTRKAPHHAPSSHPPGTLAANSHPTHENDREDDRDRCNCDEWHGGAHGRRQHEQNGDRQNDLDDLAGGALPRNGPQATADVTHFPAMTDAAMDIAGDPAREHQVEEHRPVVGGDGGR
jgi:hypothetical protein